MFKIKKYSEINLRYAWFALGILSLLNVMNYADRNIFNSLVDPIKHQFAFSDLQMGELGSAFLFVYAIAAYPFARLADRGFRKAVLVTGAIVWSGATFFTGLAGSFAALFGARGILGIGEASYATTLAPLISDYFPASMRSTALGIANAPLGLGSAVGYYVGGLSLKHWGWRHAFFFLGVPGLILGIAAMFLREPKMGLGDGKKTVRENQAPTKEQVLSLFSSKTLVYLWGSSILLTFSMGGMLFWMAPLLDRSFGFTPANAAIAGATAAVIGSVLGVVMGGYLADVWSRRLANAHIWAVILCNGFTALFALILLLISAPKAALVCIGLIAFFQMATNGPILAAMMNVTIPPLRSTCSAVYLFLIHVLGDAVSPTVIGFFSTKLMGGNIKNALFFLVPWVTFGSAILAIGALKTYAKEKKQMLESF